jgi:hypothetical protein
MKVYSRPQGGAVAAYRSLKLTGSHRYGQKLSWGLFSSWHSVAAQSKLTALANALRIALDVEIDYSIDTPLPFWMSADHGL